MDSDPGRHSPYGLGASGFRSADSVSISDELSPVFQHLFGPGGATEKDVDEHEEAELGQLQTFDTGEFH